MKLGVIGLGKIGTQVVLRLLGRTCCDLYVYDPDRRPCAKAAFVCETAAQVCETCGIVFLTMDSDVDHLALLNGAGEFLRSGSIVVDMTPVSPAQAHQNANVFRRAGISYLDCGIFSPDGNLDAPFLCFVGGNGDIFSRICPLLRCIAPDCRHMGAAGRGQAVRMLCLALAASLERELEHTVMLAEGLGIERQYFLDAVSMIDSIAKPLGALDGERPAFAQGQLQQGSRVAQDLYERMNRRNAVTDQEKE